MFNYTQAAAHKIGNDIRKAAFYFNLFSPIIYIAYLIINLFAKPDFFSINLVLLLITTAYFGFFIYTSCKNVNAYIKKTVNRVYKYSKFILKALVLAILIYGVIIENGTIVEGTYIRENHKDEYIYNIDLSNEREVIKNIKSYFIRDISNI